MTQVLSAQLPLTTSLPSHHRALYALQASESVSRLSAAAIPYLGVDQIIVRTSHVALNTYDWQTFGSDESSDKILGRDGVGRVIAIGEHVRRLAVGDRVS